MACQRATFVKWARESLKPLATVGRGTDAADLAPLGAMIGDATLVSLSEGEHFAAEPLEFRNRVLEYLVEQKAFTAVAVESGVVEGRTVFDYVRGAPGDLPQVTAQGVGWTFDRLPQNRDLIQWIKAHNADPRHSRKVSFYGFDIAGSPSNPRANRGAETALVEVVKYLERVDSEAAASFHHRIDALLPYVRFDPYCPTESAGYHSLSEAQRDALTAAIADMIVLLERREARYTAASSASDYEWSHRAAIGARQTDSWLRQLPLGWCNPNDLEFLDVASDVRDRAQADNLEWILRQEGTDGKILIFAHNNHVSTSAVMRSWYALDAHGRPQPEAVRTYVRDEVAGGYLRRRHGDRLINIGNAIGGGELGSAGFRRILEPASPESVDGLAREVGVPLFLLDLRAAPEQLVSWLDQPRELGRMYEVYGKCKLRSELAVRQAFDLLFFIDSVTPTGAR